MELESTSLKGKAAPFKIRKNIVDLQQYAFAAIFDINVVVQFYPVLHVVIYDNEHKLTKKKKNWTNNKTEPQQIFFYNIHLELFRKLSGAID